MVDSTHPGPSTTITPASTCHASGICENTMQAMKNPRTIPPIAANSCPGCSRSARLMNARSALDGAAARPVESMSSSNTHCHAESKPHCGHELKSQRNSTMNSQHDMMGLIANAIAANTDPTVPGDTLPPISMRSCVLSTCSQSILLIGTRKSRHAMTCPSSCIGMPGAATMIHAACHFISFKASAAMMHPIVKSKSSMIMISPTTKALKAKN